MPFGHDLLLPGWSQRRLAQNCALGPVPVTGLTLKEMLARSLSLSLSFSAFFDVKGISENMALWWERVLKIPSWTKKIHA